MNFYKRYIGDYMRDTAHLSLLEHGAYTVLLDTMYATEKTLPSGLDALYRLCRATTRSEREAVKTVAEQFFPVNGDGTRHNNRADHEIAKRGDQSDTNRRIAVEREGKRKQHDRSTFRGTNDEPTIAIAREGQHLPSGPPVPDCPQRGLLALYRQHLPMLTQPRVWEGQRARNMRARWAQCARQTEEWPGYETVEQGLEFWEKFFSGVAATRKLTEGIPYPDGRTWRPDLVWFMNAENFAKVIEGRYHR